MYLLDTCTLSNYLKGDRDTIDKFHHTRPRNINISTITIMEIDYGLQLKPSLINKYSFQLEAIYQKVSIVEFTKEDAFAAAKIRKDLKRKGTPIGAYDLLIGATAIVRDLILVTDNLEEFERLNDLKLENWKTTPKA